MKINRQRLWIMAWFTFTRRERNGIFTLSLVLFLLQAALFYQYFLLPEPAPHQLTTDEAGFTRFFSESEPGRTGNQKRLFGKALPVIKERVDPNSFSAGDWVQQGLSEGQANAVSRWQLHGGIFRTPQDVKGMKFIPERVYQNLEKWLIFKNSSQKPFLENQAFPTSEKFKSALKPIDLNSADTVLFCELPLIGAGRARTIWRFRERLGGFYAVEQLKEIKSIPDSVYELIRPRVTIASPVYRKIDVNTVTDTLYHPYFSRALLRMMVAYRSQNGPFTQESELQKLPLVNEDLWRKIVPYIAISKLNPNP